MPLASQVAVSWPAAPLRRRPLASKAATWNSALPPGASTTSAGVTCSVAAGTFGRALVAERSIAAVLVTLNGAFLSPRQ